MLVRQKHFSLMDGRKKVYNIGHWIKAKLSKTSMPEIVSVGVGSVSRFESEPGVKVFVVEDDGGAALLVVHVVRLRVLLHGHSRHIRLRASWNPGAEAPSIALR